MILTKEEQAILDGEQGETLAKVMKTLVDYGTIFEAERFIDVSDQSGHLVTSFGVSIMGPVFDIIEQLIQSGLKVDSGFTVDPRPIDFENVKCSPLEKLVFKFVYGKQEQYEKQLQQLGLRDDQAFTCLCYANEVGNVPKKGDILSWAESSAVVYANSVLGARCNRNSALIELFGSITGKAPLFDLLTDEGRKARWIVKINTTKRPEAHVLGSAIGMRVMEDVPYIVGLDSFLGTELNGASTSYLKDMGAAAASNGAVGLFHVENVTPEAVELGQALLYDDVQEYIIDDAELQRVMDSYPNIWHKPNSKPERCFIGCPHVTYDQIMEWKNRIVNELQKQGKQRVAVTTIMTTAPQIIDRLKHEGEYELLMSMGINLSSICALMYMNNPLCAKRSVITNSNKLRTYTTAQYFTDENIARIIVKGDF